MRLGYSGLVGGVHSGWVGDVEMVAQGVRVQTKGEDIASIYTPGIVGYEFWKAEALRRRKKEK